MPTKKIIKRIDWNKELTNRINRGVKFLDSKFKRKVWLNRINLGHFILDSNRKCVLGQVYSEKYNSDVNEIVEKIGLSRKIPGKWDDVLCGFNCDEYNYKDIGMEGYDERLLESLWYVKLSELKAKVK